MASNEGWVTIKGNHVYIENGVITKGPKALMGKTRDEATNSKKKNYIKTKELPRKIENELKARGFNEKEIETAKNYYKENSKMNVDDLTDQLNSDSRFEKESKNKNALKESIDNVKREQAVNNLKKGLPYIDDKTARDYEKKLEDSFTMTKGDREVAAKEKAYIPYKYGTYTPGEFHEAEIESRNEFSTILLYPNKLQPTNEQVKSWNEGKNFEVGDIVKAPYGIGNTYTGGEMHDFKVLETGKYPVLEGRDRIEITNDQLERFNKEYLKKQSNFEKQINEGYNRFHGKTDKEISDAKDYVRKKQYRDEYYDRLTLEQKKIIDSAYKKGIQDYEREKAIGERIGDQIVKSYKNYMKAHPNSKLSEADFKKMKRG